MFRRHPRPRAVADAAVGAASGLAASFVMSAVYRPLMRAGGDETLRREKEAQAGMPPATIQAAGAAAKAVGRELPPDRRSQALGGKAIHYAYGIAWGAAFALALRAVAPRRPVATGLAFGLVLRLVGRVLLHAAVVGVAAGIVGAALFAGLEAAQRLVLEGLAGFSPLRAR